MRKTYSRDELRDVELVSKEQQFSRTLFLFASDCLVVTAEMVLESFVDDC
jgi:hypothetical protein